LKSGPVGLSRDFIAVLWLVRYGCAGQIGLEESPDAYIAKMVEVFAEVRRVLRDRVARPAIRPYDCFEAGGLFQTQTSTTAASGGPMRSIGCLTTLVKRWPKPPERSATKQTKRKTNPNSKPTGQGNLIFPLKDTYHGRPRITALRLYLKSFVERPR
jgi:hypothetical protein